MINKPFNWYHYLMLSLPAQLLIIIVCIFVTSGQIIVYGVLEEDVVVFDGQCAVEVGPVGGDGKVYKGATMECGGETINLGALEVPYLYNMLTANTEPVIVCTKKISEYLKDISWSCKMDTIEES